MPAAPRGSLPPARRAPAPAHRRPAATPSPMRRTHRLRAARRPHRTRSGRSAPTASVDDRARLLQRVAVGRMPPTSAPPKISHIAASAYPLCSPNGSSAPNGCSCITAGSSVGWPRESISDPAGTRLLYATRVLPYAIALVAKSSSSGGWPARGYAAQNGFVPKRGSVPCSGATSRSPGTLTKWNDTARARALLGPVSDAAEMMHVAQPDRADAHASRAVDPFDHRLERDHRPKPRLPSIVSTAPPSRAIDACPFSCNCPSRHDAT